MGLSARTMQAYHFVRGYYRMHGYGPSTAEVAEAMGLRAKSAAYHHLTKLREAGMITWDAGEDRSLRPVGDGV